MKKYFNISILIGIFFFGLTSCKKDETEPANEEGLKSSTGDLETPSPPEAEDAIASRAEVVFHKSYDAELSEEEAAALWERDVKQFKKESAQNKVNGVSTEFFFGLEIWSGTQTHNGTNGYAGFYGAFETDQGLVISQFVELNTEGELGDDAGGISDFYLVKVIIEEPNDPISFVRAQWANLWLHGTDGWFVKRFSVYVEDQLQSVPASGRGSLIVHRINKWLDNETSDGWDVYIADPINDRQVELFGDGLRF